MQILQVISANSKIPLAEIRVDDNNNKMEFIVDNTNGKLPEMVGNEYRKLLEVVESSSHLRLIFDSKSAPGLLRYLTNAGDVIEITTDGITCLLNGNIIDESHKIALMQAIQSGKITLAHRADINHPMVVMPTMPKPPKISNPTLSEQKATARSMAESRQEQQDYKSEGNFYHDPELESIDYSTFKDEDGWTDILQQSLLKNLMYSAKRGGKNAR